MSRGYFAAAWQWQGLAAVGNSITMTLLVTGTVPVSLTCLPFWQRAAVLQAAVLPRPHPALVTPSLTVVFLVFCLVYCCQGGNGLAWSSTVLVIVFESQSLAVRPAGMAVCIAVVNLAQSVLESRLLCLLKTMYYILVLVFAVTAFVSCMHECTISASNCLSFTCYLYKTTLTSERGKVWSACGCMFDGP